MFLIAKDFARMALRSRTPIFNIGSAAKSVINPDWRQIITEVMVVIIVLRICISLV